LCLITSSSATKPESLSGIHSNLRSKTNKSN
jgi:hypothetical protein